MPPPEECVADCSAAFTSDEDAHDSEPKRPAQIAGARFANQAIRVAGKHPSVGARVGPIGRVKSREFTATNNAPR